MPVREHPPGRRGHSQAFKKVDEIIKGRQPIFLIWLLALQFGKLITDGK
jgi:hypothetical protein